MSLIRRQLLQAIAACIALPTIACQRNISGLPKDKIMHKFPMKTHASGRFLIDIPAVAKDVVMSQRIFGTKIEWKLASETEYRSLLSKRVNELQGTNSVERLLVSDEAGAVSKSRIISFEEDTSRDGFIGYEGYRYADEVRGYFLLSGSAARRNIANIIPNVNEVFRLVRPRLIDPIMNDRGICFDHAFVNGADPQWGETIAIMADFENVRIGLSTQVVERIDDGPSLLQRAERINGFPDARILRKSKREISGLNGEELAFKDVPSDEYSPFSLQWEYPGRENSITAPRVEASINTLGPTSMSDEEVLGLWDIILESIRLRPGAG